MVIVATTGLGKLPSSKAISQNLKVQTYMKLKHPVMLYSLET